MLGWSIASSISSIWAAKSVRETHCGPVRSRIGSGDERRERGFVVPGAAIFVEPERDRAQVARPDFGRERGERRRVQARRQEDADGHIGNEVVAHAVLERGVQPFARGLRGKFERGGIGGREFLRDAEIRFRLAAAAGIDQHGASRRERLDPFVKRMRIGQVPPEIKTHMAGSGGAGVDLPPFEQRLDLRGEAKAVSVVRVVQRLDAEGVASEEERPFDGIVNCRTRTSRAGHAPSPPRARHRGAAALRCRWRSGIGIRAPRAAPQLAVVVDLAVEGDVKPPIRGAHGLGAGFRQVDDGQPAVGEARALVGRWGPRISRPLFSPFFFIPSFFLSFFFWPLRPLFLLFFFPFFP